MAEARDLKSRKSGFESQGGYQPTYFGYTDVIDAVANYGAQTGRFGWYLVLDGDSYLKIAAEIDAEWNFHLYKSKFAELLCGLQVVVIKTDGIPFMQVVGYPREMVVIPNFMGIDYGRDTSSKAEGP